MELKLTECSEEKIIEYALKRKEKHEKDNAYHYSYLTEARFRKVFQYMQSRRTKCTGKNYLISDIDGFISKFTMPEIENKETMEECLFHEAWCKCEWIYRILDKERKYYDVLKEYIGNKTIKELERI